MQRFAAVVYPDDGSPSVIDWQRAISEMRGEQMGKKASIKSARFDFMLAETIVAVADKVGEPRVALSGGCSQNHCLTERAVARLREEEFQLYRHQRVPPNDSGIALAQITAATGQRNINSPA